VVTRYREIAPITRDYKSGTLQELSKLRVSSILYTTSVIEGA